uniref:acylaminoacyl-peptidase n=1 Tax=Cyclopterus lumpus TaxID=8103 RepID=A0A8C3AQY0_CYCLU
MLNNNLTWKTSPCSHSEWSQSDLVRVRLRAFISPLLVRVLSGLSPIQGLRAVVRETSGHQLLEVRKADLSILLRHQCWSILTDRCGFLVVAVQIWDRHGLRKCLNLTALNKHGRVYDDAQFGCLSWSECENKLLYVAEKIKNTSIEKHDGESPCRKDRSVYCEDWGESLTNKSVPVICVVNLQSGSISVLQGVPHDVSPGQALWAPSSQSVFLVGWYHEPFRLGLRFYLYLLVVFRLLCSGFPSSLIFFVFVVASSAGFYDLPDYGSWKLLTVQKDLMVVCCSSPNTPPTLRVGFLPSAGETVTWQTLQQPVMTFDFHWTVLDVTTPPEEDNTHYSGLDFGAVLVKPSRPPIEAKTPLVVFIHGGPHSQFPAEWNCTTAGLAKLGFAVLMVNYRGSTGFGQDSILSLIGQIGSQDVKDVQTAVRTALQRDIALDPNRLAVIGGSHGGFLSCHLVGQYPEFYRACAARNPVINAATLLGTSDIVDCVGIQYSYDQIPTAEALAAMLEKSPITHAAQIKAPVLLMLGGRDRRVSPHQGLELYKALKSRASPVRLLWFPEDGHSLSRVDTQADCFLNTVLWLHQHL